MCDSELVGRGTRSSSFKQRCLVVSPWFVHTHTTPGQGHDSDKVRSHFFRDKDAVCFSLKRVKLLGDSDATDNYFCHCYLLFFKSNAT